MKAYEANQKMDRRRFLYSATALGAGLSLTPTVLGAAQAVKKPDALNVALIGAGEQGRTLAEAAIRIPGVRFQAVCDIWPYSAKRAAGRLRAYKHGHNKYEDYREMLAQEKGLDAAIIASPDCFHAEHTVACLEAGLHVYCEKEMSNTLAGARKMVEAARRTGKLLQIDHQRRSNPRYIFCRDTLLKKLALLGRITAINGQWNRSVHDPEGWPKDYELDVAVLKRYGYESMHQLRNWRWYKHLGGGPIVDLGSHQIDIYNWFLDAQPTSVLASGRTNYYDKKTHEWYDTVMAVYEYNASQGPVSAQYQTISTNSSQGYFESFMGHEGTLLVSEKAARCRVYRESWVDEKKWDPWVRQGYLSEPEVPKSEKPKSSGVTLDVRESIPAPSYQLQLDVIERVHQPHLENFFDAVRGKATLTCPSEIGYETAVTVLKVNEAIAAGRKLNFKPAEFVV